MLEINPDIVYRITELAREFHAKEAVVFPHEAENESGDWAMQVLADHADDATYEELKATIESLEHAQQATIVALMWVGRGDFDAYQWDEAYAEAKERWTPHTADYLISTPLVADYLEEGLSLFGYSRD